MALFHGPRGSAPFFWHAIAVECDDLMRSALRGILRTMSVSSGDRRDNPRVVIGVAVSAVVIVAVWGANRVWREVRRYRA